MHDFILLCQRVGIDFETGYIEEEKVHFVITKSINGKKVANYFFSEKGEYLNCYKHGEVGAT
jgi:hypothetical protein